MRWLIAGIASACCVAATPILLVLGATAASSSTSGNLCQPGQAITITPGTGGLDQTQLGNAQTIISVGDTMQVPEFGLVVAIAVARQESDLHNLANDSIPASQALTVEGSGHDHDSLGVFQQRANWGSITARMDVTVSARAFYTHLNAVHGWQQMTVTAAGQAVQHSGTPGAYQRWTVLAEQVVTTVTGGTPLGQCQDMVASDVSGAAGAAISKAEEALGTMYQWGGDCSDPHNVDPSRHCDCSALTRVSYKAAGITIPRTSEAQWFALPHVPGVTAANVASLARPGDLIYYEWGADGIAGPGHVSLIIGGGDLVEASTSGQPVAIRPIYTSSFVGLTRSFT